MNTYLIFFLDHWTIPYSRWIAFQWILSNKRLLNIKDLIKLDAISFKKDKKDTRLKHIFLSEKGEKLFDEIFSVQKKRIYNAFLNSTPEEVLFFDNVLKKIIHE